MIHRDGSARLAAITAEGGVNVHRRDADGNTALMSAARHDHSDCIHTLFKLGAELDDQNHQGWTAMMDAAWNGNASSHVDLL